MAKLLNLSEVSVYTRNLKLAKEFYTRKIGLKVRSEMKKMDYLMLGTTKGGEDAGIDLWQPDPKWGQEMYDSTMKSVGIVTGIGFRTSNFDRTLEQLTGRGVKVERESDTFARFWDPDGNTLFIEGERRPKVRRAGLQSVSFVTVSVRDEDKSAEFFKTLGFKGRKIPGESYEEGQTMTAYRISPKGTAIMPFMPRREMYDNPADYDADMGHIGEDTGIGIEVDDINALEERLVSKGVEFAAKPEKQDWGGIRARILDPSGNRYMIYEWE